MKPEVFIILTQEKRSQEYPSAPDHFETGLLPVLEHWYWATCARTLVLG